MLRHRFLGVALAAGAAVGAINRQAVVDRHKVVVTAVDGTHVDPRDVLVVGNGDFAFQVDISGAQTFNDTYSHGPASYDLNTMSGWGWHVTPFSPDCPKCALERFNFSYFDSATGVNTTRKVPYWWGFTNNSAPGIWGWFEGNVHRLNLGQTSLRLATAVGNATLPIFIDQIQQATQTQDMLQGAITSSYVLNTSVFPPAQSCASGGENSQLVLSCGSESDVIVGVTYAAYGVVTGSCGSGFTVNPTCNSTNATSSVEAACVGQPLCKVAVTNAFFGGDPCLGTVKSAAVIVKCASKATLPVSSGDAPPAPSYAAIAGAFNVTVTTVVHPDVDMVAIRAECNPIESSGAATCPLALRVTFPYGSQNWGPASSDWGSGAAHTSVVVPTGPTSVAILRTLDSDGYRVDCAWSSSGEGAGAGFGMVETARHVFDLLPMAPGTGSVTVELRCLYSPPNLHFPAGARMPWVQAKANATAQMISGGLASFDATATAAAGMWDDYWSTGAFVDLASSTDDARAFELERRVVLSRYLLRVHNAGAEPPQETGLLCNSWAGHHHLEMRFWHHGHWGMWDKTQLLQRSDGFYIDLMPNASSLAEFQGYKGIRWFKETGNVPNRSGIDVKWLSLEYNPFPFGDPSEYGNMMTWDYPYSANAAVVWQQPHPIWIADLQRRWANATRGPAAALAVMQAQEQIVFGTADFLSSFPYVNETDGHYWIHGPPVVGAEEMGDGSLHNPSFELVQFAYALDVANEWKSLLGLPQDPHWADVASRLSKPVVDIGSDASHPTYSFNLDCACVFNLTSCPPNRYDKTQCDVLTSHPAMVGIYGMINGRAQGDRYGVDIATANNTVAMVASLWGWGGPHEGTNVW